MLIARNLVESVTNYPLVDRVDLRSTGVALSNEKENAPSTTYPGMLHTPTAASTMSKTYPLAVDTRVISTALTGVADFNEAVSTT